ncbi:hypothetical protein BGX26_001970 [Mortierella sp. AD094]|nr:hypothetical protein BGX26_001970 [Mortierella sp. AD094]
MLRTSSQSRFQLSYILWRTRRERRLLLGFRNTRHAQFHGSSQGPSTSATSMHTLWRVTISIPDDDDERSILLDKVSEKKKLKATTKLSKVFDTELPEDIIHILVQHPPLAQRDLPQVLDPIANFTVTINGITPKTVEWITTSKTTTLDHLRKVIYDKHPTLRDSSQTVVYEYKGCAPGYLSTLQTHVEMSVRNGVKHFVLRPEDPPKLFSDITFDDPFRLYGVHVDPPQLFDDTRSISFTSDKHAHGRLWIPVLHQRIPHACYHLFPERKMKPGKKLAGRRAYGALDYALDNIISNRKRKRGDDDDNDGTDDTAPVVSYGIATDLHGWHLQQCRVDKPQEIGYNFPTIHSAMIPTILNLAADKDKWREDTKKILGHIVWHLQSMVDDTPK